MSRLGGGDNAVSPRATVGCRRPPAGAAPLACYSATTSAGRARRRVPSCSTTSVRPSSPTRLTACTRTPARARSAGGREPSGRNTQVSSVGSVYPLMARPPPVSSPAIHHRAVGSGSTAARRYQLKKRLLARRHQHADAVQYAIQAEREFVAEVAGFLEDAGRDGHAQRRELRRIG